MKRPHRPDTRVDRSDQTISDPSCRRSRARSGFTLIEVMVTMVVLVFGIGAVVTTLVMTTSLGNTNRESNIAATAARGAIESMKATDEWSEVFARFNADPSDDPDGIGTAPGNTFTVPGLNVDPDDPDGIQGEILFVGNGVQLREDVADVELGMPRDLNKDGVIDALDHKDDYWILPVRVRVEWTGETGPTSLEYSTVLTR